MEFGYIVGWTGVILGFCVAPPQLYKIIKTGKTSDISIWTYLFLVGALICYTWHAFHIGSIVFEVAQSFGLIINSIILGILIRRRLKARKTGIKHLLG